MFGLSLPYDPAKSLSCIRPMIQTDRDTQRNNLETYWFYSEGERRWSGDVGTRVRTHRRPVDMGIRHVDVEVGRVHTPHGSESSLGY